MIRQMCSRVYIMYAGRVVESGDTKEVLAHPLHPYTKGLIASIPSLAKTGPAAFLHSRHSAGPLEDRSEHGCPFCNRCYKCRDICEKETPPMVVHKGHMALCVDAKEELGTVSAQVKAENKAPPSGNSGLDQGIPPRQGPCDGGTRHEFGHSQGRGVRPGGRVWLRQVHLFGQMLVHLLDPTSGKSC